MKSKFPVFLVISAFLFAGIGVLFAKTPARSRRSGRVISSILSGQGSTRSQSGKTFVRRTDMWWTYCISSEGVLYSVLSRQGPGKTGLINDASIQFSERTNQIRIIDPQGKNIDLKILRKSASEKCP